MEDIDSFDSEPPTLDYCFGCPERPLRHRLIARLILRKSDRAPGCPQGPIIRRHIVSPWLLRGAMVSFELPGLSSCRMGERLPDVPVPDMTQPTAPGVCPCSTPSAEGQGGAEQPPAVQPDTPSA